MDFPGEFPPESSTGFALEKPGRFVDNPDAD